MTQPQDPAQDPDLERIVATSEDEYDREADVEPGEVSIDDALEADRADGSGLDADLERGADDATAAEQGNRDEDRMDAELPEEELPEQ